MALNETENKIETTMDLIPGAGFPIGYANMMRFMSDAQGNFNADLRRYFSEEYRKEDPYSTPALIGIGGQLPQSVKKQLFALVYPYVEAEFHKQKIIEDQVKALETAKQERKDLGAQKAQELEAITPITEKATEEERAAYNTAIKKITSKYTLLHAKIETDEQINEKCTLQISEVYAKIGIDEA